MEWSMNINDIFKDEITKITNSLIPPGFEGDMHSIRLMQDSVSKVINKLGESSAKEQGLNKVITTAEKLRTADSQTLYLLKDAAANEGRGEMVAMLKMGRKHLFLFDENKVVRELEPMCVLDFYVIQGRQRTGLGKTLFNHMLKDMQTSPHRLAVDGPSNYMMSFLRKNYGVQHLIRQSNNFGVSPQFFAEPSRDEVRCWVPCKNILSGDAPRSEASTPSVSSGVGRYTAPRPASSIANIIHGGTPFDRNANSADGESQCSSPAPSPEAPSAPTLPEAPTACAAPALARAAMEARCSPSRPRTLPVTAVDAPPPPHAPAPAPDLAEPTPAGAPSRRDSQLTDQGYFDVKFYHKKLW